MKNKTEQVIGKIGNYYGGLTVKNENEKYYWSICDYNGEDWEEIPEYLYLALLSFAKGNYKENNNGN